MLKHFHLSLSLLLLLLAGGLTACMNEGNDDCGAEQGKPIEFSAAAEEGWQTRVSGTTFSSGDKFGIFAFYGSSTEPNFMKNQKVEYDGTAWTYSPIKYWPTSNNATLTFYAYYPYNSSAALTTEKKLTFTMPDDADTDFLVASNTQTRGAITLNFKHLLGKVVFKIKRDPAVSSFNITGITGFSVTANKTLTYDFANLTSTSESSPENPSSYNYTLRPTFTSSLTVGETESEVATGYFVPSTLTDGTLTLTRDGSSTSMAITIPEKTVVAGQTLTYHITVTSSSSGSSAGRRGNIAAEYGVRVETTVE
ncbi:MAG: fimbrillin family protein [Alloprevotella sp.]